MTLLYERARRTGLRGEQVHDRELYAVGAIDVPQSVWWEGHDVGRGTLVQVTGSQTLTEQPFDPKPELEVTSVAGASANDLNVLLYPFTLNTGQTWRTTARLGIISGTAFLMAALVMTDGTTAGSNVVTSMMYRNSNGAIHHGGWNGTLTGVSTATGDAQVFFSTWAASEFVLQLAYTAANTFVGNFYIGGQSTNVKTSGNISKTMTPTHIGIGWSNWGTAPSVPEINFGPIYRVA